MMFQPSKIETAATDSGKVHPYHAEIQRVRAALLGSARLPAALCSVEEKFLTARRDHGELGNTLRAAISAYALDNQNSVARDSIGSISAELEKAERRVGEARAAATVAREKYGHTFRNEIAPHAPVVRALLNEIIDVLDDAVSVLVDANNVASQSRIVAPRFLQDAPRLAHLTRQLRQILGNTE